MLISRRRTLSVVDKAGGEDEGSGGSGKELLPLIGAKYAGLFVDDNQSQSSGSWGIVLLM